MATTPNTGQLAEQLYEEARFETGEDHNLAGAKNRAVGAFPGNGHDPQHRYATKAEPNGNGKRRQTGGEICRTVERIQKPQIVRPGMYYLFAFLADNAVVGKSTRDGCAQDLLRAAIGLGHGCLLAFFFKFDRQRRAKVLRQYRPSLTHHLNTEYFRAPLRRRTRYCPRAQNGILMSRVPAGTSAAATCMATSLQYAPAP